MFSETVVIERDLFVDFLIYDFEELRMLFEAVLSRVSRILDYKHS